jgi:peptidoglycan/LPS O-acetylase OafA/YrhL
MKKGRIIFFDLLRIVAISAIVLIHVLTCTGRMDLVNITVPGTGIRVLAVLGMDNILFVSGCALAYSYGPIRSSLEYGRFIGKRLLRLYPAYWCSLLLAIGLNVLFFLAYRDFRLGGLTAWDYLLSFSGFQAFFGQWGGRINEAGWFIGLIVCLYLLYPLLARAFSKSPVGTLVAIFLIDLSARALILSIDPADTGSPTRWFPLCSLFEFGLGIFIVRSGLYPGLASRSPVLSLLSDLSFYVFLVHIPLLYLVRLNILLFIVATMALAYLLYRVDRTIKSGISGRFKGLEARDASNMIKQRSQPR